MLCKLPFIITIPPSSEDCINMVCARDVWTSVGVATLLPLPVQTAWMWSVPVMWGPVWVLPQEGQLSLDLLSGHCLWAVGRKEIMLQSSNWRHE